MNSINQKRSHQTLYHQAKNSVSLVQVPEMNFLMIDGKGNPNNNPEYTEAVSALYAVAYTLKFTVKKGPLQSDYKVLPLEGLWWTDNMAEFSLEDRGIWMWRMMILQPEIITAQMATQAIEDVRKKKKPPRLDEIRFESFEEGLAAQILHIGPYGEAERPSVEKLHTFLKENNLEPEGKHHEIYFNSPLRTDPSKLKTIIRQPAKKK